MRRARPAGPCGAPRVGGRPALRILAAGLAIALGLACALPADEPRTPLPPEGGGTCENLAQVFFAIAQSRDRGRSKRQQVRALRRSVDSPFSEDPEVTFRQLERVIEWVYERPESAGELAQLVREDCVVNEKGQAVLRTIFATPDVSSAR